jgi:hypothetical protein
VALSAIGLVAVLGPALFGLIDLGVVFGTVPEVFWTGGDVAGSAAQAFADAIGGETIGSTSLGEVGQELQAALEADGAAWPEIRQTVWEPLSQQFASMAEDTANAFVNNLNPNSVWAAVEYPTLMNNPAVTQIAINYMEGAPLTIEQWFEMGDLWAAGGSSVP